MQYTFIFLHEQYNAQLLAAAWLEASPEHIKVWFQ